MAHPAERVSVLYCYKVGAEQKESADSDPLFTGFSYWNRAAGFIRDRLGAIYLAQLLEPNLQKLAAP